MDTFPEIKVEETAEFNGWGIQRCSPNRYRIYKNAGQTATVEMREARYSKQDLILLAERHPFTAKRKISIVDGAGQPIFEGELTKQELLDKGKTEEIFADRVEIAGLIMLGWDEIDALWLATKY